MVLGLISIYLQRSLVCYSKVHPYNTLLMLSQCVRQTYKVIKQKISFLVHLFHVFIASYPIQLLFNASFCILQYNELYI